MRRANGISSFEKDTGASLRWCGVFIFELDSDIYLLRRSMSYS